MFAHQVIEDIVTIFNAHQEHPYSIYAASHIRPIFNAQKFHMGDGDSINTVAKMQPGSLLFDRPDLLKLPYDTLWFDYTVDKNKKQEEPASPLLYKMSGSRYCINTKEAVLVKKISNTVWKVTTFTYTDSTKKWLMGLFSCLIFVGSLEYADNIDVTERFLNMKIGRNIAKRYVIPLISAEMTGSFPRLSDMDYVGGMLKEFSINYGFLESSIKLLNCKNIHAEKVPAPVKLNKKRERSGKQPIFDYHVLNLVLPSNKKREYQEQSAPLSHNRVHLCRGHFKEYTEEHPLFGRHTGLYWWEPSVRGQNRDGIVVKDYATKRRNP